MAHAVRYYLWRLAVTLWLRTSRSSWRRDPVPRDSPHVHAPGTDPDRILVAGDGASAGHGVLTHDLGLAGYLARNLSLITMRATDADLVVSADMTAVSCRAAIEHVELSRFDVILLTVGANEALAFADEHTWASDLGRLLDDIDGNSPRATGVVVISIAQFDQRSSLPALLRGPVNRSVARLNEITRRLVARRERMVYLPFDAENALEATGAHSYQRWAARIAPEVASLLEPPGRSSTRSEVLDEDDRQAALVRLGVVDRSADPVLDQIALAAKKTFGTRFASVTLIERDRQSMAAVAGMDAVDVGRNDSFCDTTIRRATSMVIEDTTLDYRYADFPSVAGAPGIRFYAGYPIESPDGHRIGALCVMDTEPRRFSDSETVLLRSLAQRAQARLWELGAGEASD